MKKLIAILVCLASVAGYAGQKAITDSGETVVLYSNGTWEKEGSNSVNNYSDVTTVNSIQFKKPVDSSFLLRSTKTNSAIWLNTSKWSFTKSVDNIDAEYEFRLRGEDVYGMFITEKIEYPIDFLLEATLINAMSVDPNAKVVKREQRTVNGETVIYQEIESQLMGANFTYLYYLHSDSSGSTQLSRSRRVGVQIIKVSKIRPH